MSPNDHQKRLKFARIIARDHPEADFWTERVAFFFDGVSFRDRSLFIPRVGAEEKMVG